MLRLFCHKFTDLLLTSVEVLWKIRIVSIPKELHDLDTKGQVITETCNSWNKLIISQTLSAFCTGEIDVNWIWFRFWSKNPDKFFSEKQSEDICAIILT